MQLIQEDFDSKFKYVEEGISGLIKKWYKEYNNDQEIELGHLNLAISVCKEMLEKSDPSPNNKFFHYLLKNLPNTFTNDVFTDSYVMRNSNIDGQIRFYNQALTNLMKYMEKKSFKETYPNVLDESIYNIHQYCESYKLLFLHENQYKALLKQPEKYTKLGDWTLFILDDPEVLYNISQETGWCTKDSMNKCEEYIYRSKNDDRSAGGAENPDKKYKQLIKEQSKRIELDLDEKCSESPYFEDFANSDYVISKSSKNFVDNFYYELKYEYDRKESFKNTIDKYFGDFVKEYCTKIDGGWEVKPNTPDPHDILKYYIAYSVCGSLTTRYFGREFAKEILDRDETIYKNLVKEYEEELAKSNQKPIENDQVFCAFLKDKPMYLIDPYSGQFRPRFNRESWPVEEMKIIQKMFAKISDKINWNTKRSMIEKSTEPRSGQDYWGTFRHEWDILALIDPNLYPEVRENVLKTLTLEYVDLLPSYAKGDKNYIYRKYFGNDRSRSSHEIPQLDLQDDRGIKNQTNHPTNYEIFSNWTNSEYSNQRVNWIEDKFIEDNDFENLYLYMIRFNERHRDLEEILKQNSEEFWNKYIQLMRRMAVVPDDKNYELFDWENIDRENYNYYNRYNENIQSALDYVKSINSRVPLFEKVFKTNIEFVGEYCKLFESLKRINLKDFIINEKYSDKRFSNPIILKNYWLEDLCELYHFDKDHLLQEIRNLGYDAIVSEIGKIIDLRNNPIEKKISTLLSEGEYDEYQIKMNDTLCDKLWENKKLKSNVRTALLKIAKKFLESLDIEESLKIVDITFTGSLANYNYTKYSDIDLHIIIDFKDDETLQQLLLSKKTLWNFKHDIKIYDHDVEIYPQCKDEEHTSSGVYSLLKNKWINEPKSDKDAIDMDAVNAKVESWIELIDNAVEQEQMDVVDDKINNARKSGLEKGGEYSIENLAFKVLRNMGYIDKMKDEKKNQFDKEMSIVEKKLMEMADPKYGDDIEDDLAEKGNEDIHRTPQETRTSVGRNDNTRRPQGQEADQNVQDQQENPDDSHEDLPPIHVDQNVGKNEIMQVRQQLLPQVEKLANQLSYGSPDYKKTAQRIMDVIEFAFKVETESHKKIREAFGVDDAPLFKGMGDILGASLRPLTNALGGLLGGLGDSISKMVDKSADKNAKQKSIKLLQNSLRDALSEFEVLKGQIKTVFGQMGKESEAEQVILKLEEMMQSWTEKVNAEIHKLETPEEEKFGPEFGGEEGAETGGEQAVSRWKALKVSYEKLSSDTKDNDTIPYQTVRGIGNKIKEIEATARRDGIDFEDRWSYHRSSSKYIRIFNSIKWEINKINQEIAQSKKDAEQEPKQ